jgi:type IV secretion system protein VirB5
MLASGSARAQFAVIDVANLAQQVQQVAAWAQQYKQMVQDLQNQVQQINQLTVTYNAMTGTRGFEGLLNGASQQSARRYLPADLAQIAALYNGSIVPGYGTLTARINKLQVTLSTLPPGYFADSADAQASLKLTLSSLATEQAVAEAAYQSVTDRIPLVEGLMAAIRTTNDPKGIAELQARIAGEQVLSVNETNRMQMLLYQQQMQRDQKEQRALEAFASAQRAPIPTAAFPTAAY